MMPLPIPQDRLRNAIDAWRAATAKLLCEVDYIVQGRPVDHHRLESLKADIDAKRGECTLALDALRQSRPGPNPSARDRPATIGPPWPTTTRS